MKQLTKAELIVNNDGSVYHLGLKPEHLYKTIVTVGDLDRVSSIAHHFDEIHYTIQNREFKTIGGKLRGKNLMVISTGIGTDNVDIVFNELAFLLNYDLKSGICNEKLDALDIVRLGTSGSVSPNFELDSIVYSEAAISFDDLFLFYNHTFSMVTFDKREYPVIEACSNLMNSFRHYQSSLTLTAKGFYGPQFRHAQLAPKYTLEQLDSISFKGKKIGNIEMETAGIYGLAKLLGFNAISINALLANRLTGEFSANTSKVIDKMICECLEVLCP